MRKEVLKDGYGEVIEKKSRFIGELHHISDADEAKSLIAAARKKYYDARHHCYAYLLGAEGEIKKYGDDGEPQGTAGLPMLSVLEGKELTDCIVIVTRYFGGTLLGTGGLVRAYTAAAETAAADAKFAMKVPAVRIVISSDYKNEGALRRICASFADRGVHIVIENVEYSSACDMIVAVDSKEIESFERNVTEALSGQADIERNAEIFLSVPVK